MISTFLLLAGLLLLYGGAELLVRGASGLSLRSGISPLVVGLTVVAFGTSAPEVVLGVQAALQGQGGIAIGSAVGSNIANVGLVLGVAVLIRPIRVDPRLLRAEIPLVLGASVLVAALLFDRVLGRAEGGLLAAALLLYLGFSVFDARRNRPHLQLSGPETPSGSIPGDLIRALGGLALLVIGAASLIQGGVSIAAAVGVPPEAIALTMLAIGTSLPELTTSVVAAIRGKGALALGNVVGSNLFNLLGALGLSALVRPLQAPALAFVDIAAMMAAAVILLPLAATQRLFSRVEGGILLALYVLYVAFVLAR